MGLEGCFLVWCATIKDLSIEKRILKKAKKIRPRAAKMLQRHFIGLIFARFVFLILKSFLDVKLLKMCIFV